MASIVAISSTFEDGGGCCEVTPYSAYRDHGCRDYRATASRAVRTDGTRVGAGCCSWSNSSYRLRRAMVFVEPPGTRPPTRPGVAGLWAILSGGSGHRDCPRWVL